MLLLAGTRVLGQEGDYKYIASKRSQVYHDLSCEWAQKIAPGNMVYFRTVEEAEASGRRPCKVCFPDKVQSDRVPPPSEKRTEPRSLETETKPGPRAEPITMSDHTWWSWDTLISIIVVTTIAVVAVLISYLWKSRRAYSKASPVVVGISPVVVKRDTRIPASLADWLYDHFASLTVDQQKHLARLRDEYKRFPHADQRTEYGETWEIDSRKIRTQRPFCEVCGRRSEHVHHRHYRSSQPDAVDVVSLCVMCHYFIHPRVSMTRDAFERYKQGLS